MNNILAKFATLFIHICIVQALYVMPNSTCTDICIDDDIVCTDSGFFNTTVGEKFVSCIKCLQNSNFSNADKNDQDYFIGKFLSCSIWAILTL